MKMKWRKVKEEGQYGVAIHNYLEEKEHRLKLYVGDAVHILEHFGDDWYLGCTVKNRNKKGIFPKSYIKIRDDKESELPIVQEMTAVLREWGAIVKQLYISHSKIFKDIENRIYELVKLRSEILSGTLPQDELREMKQKVASRIDMGNNLLGLDLVVRDEQCNILNPELTSTVELYNQHLKATEDIKKQSENLRSRSPTVTISQFNSFTLYVNVRNFVCKMSDDAELLICLYDVKESAPFTEYYVVKWSKEGFVRDINQFSSLRVLFKDLGSRDVVRDKVYLVCYVVRVGSMDVKENEKENRRNSHQLTGKKSYNISTEFMRRPFGVSALDITLYMSGKLICDEEKDIFIPFVPCEKETLDQTLKRIIGTKDMAQKEYKGHGLWFSLKLLRGDLKQVREENPHLVLGNISIARKMGFPEVILPGDVRNDLYITLVQGEFTKIGKTSDKNVQVTVSVCNEKGVPLQGCIFMGAEAMTEYKSVIYYHEDKPKWNEIFKVAVPIEEFKSCHLKMTFKHRSSNEAKDKSEKSFAMSFVKLMLMNGTTLPDTTHNLLVYRIDHKKYDDTDLGYLTLPCVKGDENVGKVSCPGLVLSPKDAVLISTKVCSTKLTQNLDLLGLLNWAGNPDGLEDSLRSLTKVDGEEVVKFLQDVLDSLFNILMQNSDCDKYDDLVFECLLFIIGLVSDRKYQHFEPVLDVYIEESFSATLAYNKLVVVLKSHLDKATTQHSDHNFVYKIMKSLKYCIRFIVRSRLLFSELYEGKGREQFEISLKDLLNTLTTLMCLEAEKDVLKIQAACLKYLPSIIPDIMKVLHPAEISRILAELLKKTTKLLNLKMTMANEIVKGPLFLFPDSRAILLPVITRLVRELLEARDEVTSCIKIVSDIMDLLFKDEKNMVVQDVTEVMLNLLRTVIQTSISMDREKDNRMVSGLVVIMLSIFRQMTSHHFEAYIIHFKTSVDRLDFLMEILLVFKDLVSKPVFPKDWCEMIMLQNNIILKSLRYFSHTIRDYFFSPFEHQAWNNFFHGTIAFLTQPSLQLETFSQNKRARIVSRYRDMRRETAFEIRSMWFNLGQHKIQFVPGLVGSILDMTLVSETELRKATIPIFFDMMQCEFYSRPDFVFSKRDATYYKGNFNEFENEIIAKLDVLFEGGRGDEEYRDLFKSIMLNLCEQHSSLNTLGVKFVNIVSRLMERLLQYRSIITDENKENRMSCTVNLLDFYSEINRKEMYIRYVNKLCDLHLECDNYTEAAFTLKLHASLLNWTEETLRAAHLRSHKHPTCQTHLDLKEALYHDMINYFDKGKMWEYAIELCEELEEQYKELFDYVQLGKLSHCKALFYEAIMEKLRPEPEYFRVTYYGGGFPPFLQNKTFIYRGKQFERLGDFSNRALNQLPNAELMNTLETPSKEIQQSNAQYLQINKVDPVMDERKYKFNWKRVPVQIRNYYRVNNVQKFQFSRPTYRGEGEDFGNLWLERTVLVTSYPLPGILMWFPVTSSNTFMISPLENAIETMEASNKSLREMIIHHRANPTALLQPLSMKLNGIVDAAVMGGIANYEKAFFTTEYELSHSEESKKIATLKNLIAEQIPLLEVGISLHKQKSTLDLLPFHNRIEECFSDMQTHVVSKYGRVESDLSLINDNSLSRHRQALSMISLSSMDNRDSIASLTPSDLNNVMVSPFKIMKITSSLQTPSLTRSKDKSKRKSKGTSTSVTNNKESSQWYTGPEVSVVKQLGSPPVIELRQELTPKRPLRSEMERERRLSRPSSGQFNLNKLTNLTNNSRLSQTSMHSSSNRDSTGTTGSTTSEDDPTPPPLPVKQREADYSNLPDGIVDVDKGHAVDVQKIRSKPGLPPPEISSKKTPPTPPPKRNQKVV